MKFSPSLLLLPGNGLSLSFELELISREINLKSQFGVRLVLVPSSS